MIRFVETWLPGRAVAMVVWRETIFVRRGYHLNEWELAHELRHIVQMRNQGWLGYILGYVVLWLLHGYDEHPWEVAANEAVHDPVYLEWARMVMDGTAAEP